MFHKFLVFVTTLFCPACYQNPESSGWVNGAEEDPGTTGSEMPPGINWNPEPEIVSDAAPTMIEVSSEGNLVMSHFGWFPSEFQDIDWDTWSPVAVVVDPVDYHTLSAISVNRRFGDGYDFILGDVDGDGEDDILTYGLNPDEPDWALSGGYLAAMSPLPLTAQLDEATFSVSNHAVGTADVDGDGDDDLIPEIPNPDTYLTAYPHPAKGDLTGDGFPEFAGVDGVSGGVVIIPANQAAAVALWKISPLQTGMISSVTIDDVNGDDQDDLIIMAGEDDLGMADGRTVRTPRIWLGPLTEAPTWESADSKIAWAPAEYGYNAGQFFPTEFLGGLEPDGGILCYLMSGATDWGEDQRFNAGVAKVCEDGRRPEVLIHSPGWASIWIDNGNSEVVDGRLLIGTDAGPPDPDNGYRPQPGLLSWDIDELLGN